MIRAQTALQDRERALRVGLRRLELPELLLHDGEVGEHGRDHEVLGRVDGLLDRRGEQEHLQRYRENMGWQFPWYTLRDDFDADHDVGQWHGTNVFLRDGDDVYRTYFIDARGDEALGSTWSFLDITPYGRQEAWEDSPENWPQTPPYTWGGWHDKYDHTL